MMLLSILYIDDNDAPYQTPGYSLENLDPKLDFSDADSRYFSGLAARLLIGRQLSLWWRCIVYLLKVKGAYFAGAAPHPENIK